MYTCAAAFHPRGTHALSGGGVILSPAGERGGEGKLSVIDYALGERYRLPYLVCTPLTASEADILEKGFQRKLTEAERAAAAGDYSRAFGLIDEARAVPGFEHAGDALSLRRILAALFPNGKLREIRELRSLKGHEGPVHAVAVFPEGTGHCPPAAIIRCASGT